MKTFWLGQHGGPPTDLLNGAIGLAAILLVAGWIFTRWQRDRHRFALMQLALEKGVTRFPGTPPYWVMSLRQGVTLTAVGVGLMVVGGGAWSLSSRVEMPKETAVVPALTAPTTRPAREGAQPEPERRPGPGDEWNRPPHLRNGPPGGPEDNEGPEGPRGPRHEPGRGPAFDPQQPPPPQPEHPHESPDRERWHRAEAQRTIGLTSVGVGFILTLLGLVRIGFAKIEQTHVKETDELG